MSPDPLPPPSSAPSFPLTAPKRRRWHRRAAALLAVGAVAGGAVAIVAARQDGPVGYRTATVATKDLAQHLTSVGAVEPVDRGCGRLPGVRHGGRVNVKVGDAVTSGQALATLDPSSLEMAMRQQEAALDQARLRFSGPSTGRASASPTAPAANVTQASVTQAATFRTLALTGVAPVTTDPSRAARRAPPSGGSIGRRATTS